MFKRSLITANLLLASSVSFANDTPSMEEMWALIKQQQAKIEQLEAKLANTKQQLDVTSEAVEIAVTSSSNSSSSISASSRWAEKTSLGGYGEHHFNQTSNGDDMIDAHRFVVFAAHQFDQKLRFFSELEIEHGLAGEGAPGEVELEQAYIEYDFSQNHSVQVGQFLLPVGILNETHEPETFYGTERNLIEKNIIPTSWWETGTMLKGSLGEGLSYNLAIHSGLNLDGGHKVRDGRQKSAKAIANDYAYTARLKYTAIPGLELAASLQYQSDVSQGLSNNSALLSEVHAAYQTDGFGLRALWASWNIDGEAFETNGRDEQTGWYIEPSYRVNEHVGIFARYNVYNNNAGISTSKDAKYIDAGFNYLLSPQVVLKADVSKDQVGDNDSFNLGVGWSY